MSVYCCVLNVLMNGSFKPDTKQDTETESESESSIKKTHPLIPFKKNNTFVLIDRRETLG